MALVPVITYRASLYSTTNATSYATSTTYTPAANSLLVAFVAVSATSPVVPPTIAGHGLTWSAVTLTDHALSTTHRIDVYVALAGASPSSAAFTVSGYSGNQTGAVLIEFEITGHDLSVTALNNIIQSPTATGSGTTGTVTLASAAVSTNRPLSFFVHLANEATTPRTNWTETASADGNYNNPATGGEAQFRSDAFETTSTATWLTSSSWLGVALEIKGAPDQSVTGTVISSGTTLFAATLAYAVTGSALSAGAVLFAPAPAYALTTATITSGATLTPPSVTLAITASTIASTVTLDPPALTQNISGATIATTTTSYPPALPTIEIGPGPANAVLGSAILGALSLGTRPAAVLEVTGGTIASTVTVSAPTATYVVDVPVLAATTDLFAPTTAAALTTASLSSTESANPPSVAYALELPTIASTLTVNAPSVAMAVAGASIAAGTQLFEAATAYAVDLSALASSTALYTPSLGAPDQSVTASTLTSGVSLFEPTVSSVDQFVTTVAIASTTSVDAPSVSSVITGATIGSTVSVTAPTVSYVIEAPTIASSVQLSPAVIVPGAVTIDGATIAATSTLGAPTLAYGIAASAIASGSTLAAPDIEAQAPTITAGTIASALLLTPPSVSAFQAAMLVDFIVVEPSPEQLYLAVGRDEFIPVDTGDFILVESR